VFAVDLFSKDDDAKRFYQKYGFIPLQDDPLSSLFADGNSPGDVRTGGAEFTRCDQVGAWSSSTAKQGSRSFLSGRKILTEQKPLIFLRRRPCSPSFHPHSAWYILSFPQPALEARRCPSTNLPVSVSAASRFDPSIVSPSGLRGVPCFRGLPSTPSCRRGRRESTSASRGLMLSRGGDGISSPNRPAKAWHTRSKDGRAFWQWSHSTLPYGAGRRR
jgi:hypothetical protein